MEQRETGSRNLRRRVVLEQSFARTAEHGLNESVLQRVAAGDTGAVAECVDAFGGLVWSLARRILNRPSEAEDAVQEVFIALWKNASRFDPSIASETTFVAMIARRRLIDLQRRNVRRPEGDAVAVEDLPLSAPEGPSQFELKDEAAKAVAALEQLKPEQRNVLRLAVCQGWPHQLIADRLGLPLGTVKTHVRRGLIKVREELAAEGIAPSKEGER